MHSFENAHFFLLSHIGFPFMCFLTRFSITRMEQFSILRLIIGYLYTCCHRFNNLEIDLLRKHYCLSLVNYICLRFEDIIFIVGCIDLTRITPWNTYIQTTHNYLFLLGKCQKEEQSLVRWVHAPAHAPAEFVCGLISGTSCVLDSRSVAYYYWKMSAVEGWERVMNTL